MLTMNEDQVVVAWVLFMQEIELSISLQTIKNESGKIDSNKANTFSRRGTMDLLVVLVQQETS
jgi:hypothetical protein